MKVLKLIVAGCLLSVLPLQAGKWTTHFAYNNVTQIAMAKDRVYAISDGSLYSVEKQSEVLKVYNNQSGLHGTGITCIYYDEVGKQLLIGYGTGFLRAVWHCLVLKENDFQAFRKNFYT